MIQQHKNFFPAKALSKEDKEERLLNEFFPANIKNALSKEDERLMQVQNR
jgi:hypothetical protein